MIDETPHKSTTTRLAVLETKMSTLLNIVVKMDDKLDSISEFIITLKTERNTRSQFTKWILRVLEVAASIGLGGYMFKLLGV